MLGVKSLLNRCIYGDPSSCPCCHGIASEVKLAFGKARCQLRVTDWIPPGGTVYRAAHNLQIDQKCNQMKLHEIVYLFAVPLLRTLVSVEVSLIDWFYECIELT